jgi:mannose/cellobiose epimerase-like protein (N-acyl-D-glucosamine 2-epimerase family)
MIDESFDTFEHACSCIAFSEQQVVDQSTLIDEINGACADTSEPV